LAVAIPPGKNSAALADWAETVLVSDDEQALSYVRILRLLRGEGSELADAEFEAEYEDEEEGEGTEAEVDLGQIGGEEGIGRDVRLEFLIAQIKLRAKVGGDVYPFQVEDERIVESQPCGRDIYLFLLALSSEVAAFRKDRRAHEVEKNFDLIALAAMRRYLGRDAKGIRFARSVDEPDDDSVRPKKFSDAIQWLRDLLDVPGRLKLEDDDRHEKAHWEWQESYPVPNSYNDGGVDLIAWWKFGDKRAGFPVVLVQCTVQLTWERKLENIPLVLWDRWIDFSMVPPQRALVIPFSNDPEDDLWRERSLRAGVVIDRLRLLELLNELECEALASLVEPETVQWTERELQSIA
jgi:hypothetical protein